MRGAYEMFARYITMLALLLVLAGTFTGCPPQKSSAVGVWVFYLDVDCDDMDINALVFVLYSDNTAKFLFDDAYAGTWSLSNSTLTVTFPSVQSDEFELTGTLGSNVITDGTYTIGGMGNRCWTGLREYST
jgi:hypothetical protein